MEMQAFLFLMIATIAWLLLTRRINLRGLFFHKIRASRRGVPNNDPRISAGRIQLLLATVAASADFLTNVAKSTNGQMPDISRTWLQVLGASSGVYVLDKGMAAIGLWLKTQKISR
jgi:hypothetical protein